MGKIYCFSKRNKDCLMALCENSDMNYWVNEFGADTVFKTVSTLNVADEDTWKLIHYYYNFIVDEEARKYLRVKYDNEVSYWDWFHYLCTNTAALRDKEQKKWRLAMINRSFDERNFIYPDQAFSIEQMTYWKNCFISAYVQSCIIEHTNYKTGILTNDPKCVNLSLFSPMIGWQNFLRDRTTGLKICCIEELYKGGIHHE